MKTPLILKKAKHRIEKLFRRLELLPFIFSPSSPQSDQLVIVTGADSSHFKSLCQFLSSLFRYEPKLQVVVFDLGLSDLEQQTLWRTFSSLELRQFDFSQYPDYFNIEQNAGEYAWKPVIVCDVLDEFKCCVCWMDAGNVVTRPLVWLRRITGKLGMYSPSSTGRIADWTHPRTLECLEAAESLLHKRNLNGACIAVDYQNRKARDLVVQWKRCALTKECIAPQGSSRTNHRQDQAVLSVIAHQSGITEGMPMGTYGFKIHQDVD